MKNINFLRTGCILFIAGFLLVNVSCRSSQALFQEGATNWDFSGDADWAFVGDELVGIVNDEVGFAITKETFDDFVLQLEFKPDSIINSGIFLRCGSTSMNPTNCDEINIWDLHPNQDFRTGSIVKKTAPTAVVNTNYKWNTYRIRAEKKRVQVWVNDVLTADYKEDTLTGGLIGLQASGTGEIRFRNVKITPLKS